MAGWSVLAACGDRDKPAPAAAAPGDAAAPATQLPVVLLGGGDRLKGGRVLDYRGKPNRKMCSLYLSLMDRFGVHKREFGDSTERLGEV